MRIYRLLVWRKRGRRSGVNAARKMMRQVKGFLHRCFLQTDNAGKERLELSYLTSQ
jgi:hypothetical protein